MGQVALGWAREGERQRSGGRNDRDLQVGSDDHWGAWKAWQEKLSRQGGSELLGVRRLHGEVFLKELSSPDFGTNFGKIGEIPASNFIENFLCTIKGYRYYKKIKGWHTCLLFPFQDFKICPISSLDLLLHVCCLRGCELLQGNSPPGMLGQSSQSPFCSSHPTRSCKAPLLGFPLPPLLFPFLLECSRCIDTWVREGALECPPRISSGSQ